MYEDTRRVVATDLEELEAGHTARALPVAHSGANNRTILLVQSDPDEESLTLLAFQKVGLKNRVVVVRDGIAALEYLFGPGDHEGRDTQFMPELVLVLVLVDLTMPHLNSADLLRRMRLSERTKSLPVLGLVSSTEGQDVLEGQDLEADGYIQKPIEPIRLLEVLERLERLHWVVSD